MVLLSDFLSGLTERLYGPMHLRFLMQPLMACFFAFRDGKKDAMEGKSPYFWALFTEPSIGARGFRAAGNPLARSSSLISFSMFVALHGPRFRGGAIWTGIILALVPYVVLRGPINRLFTRTLAAREGSHAKSRAV